MSFHFLDLTFVEEFVLIYLNRNLGHCDLG
jgi:hypothetical protein